MNAIKEAARAVLLLDPQREPSKAVLRTRRLLRIKAFTSPEIVKYLKKGWREDGSPTLERLRELFPEESLTCLGCGTHDDLHIRHTGGMEVTGYYIACDACLSFYKINGNEYPVGIG